MYISVWTLLFWAGAILILVFLIPMRLSFLFLVFVAWPLALRGFHRD